MSTKATDEDVLNINNIIVIYSHLSPIFHNKAILSFIYSLASEHPHPPLARTPKRALLFRGTPTGPPSPTWRRLIYALLYLPTNILRSAHVVSPLGFASSTTCELGVIEMIPHILYIIYERFRKGVRGITLFQRVFPDLYTQHSNPK